MSRSISPSAETAQPPMPPSAAAVSLSSAAPKALFSAQAERLEGAGSPLPPSSATIAPSGGATIAPSGGATVAPSGAGAAVLSSGGPTHPPPYWRDNGRDTRPSHSTEYRADYGADYGADYWANYGADARDLPEDRAKIRAKIRNDSRAVPTGEIDILELLGTLWSSKRLILAAMAASLLIGAVVTLATPPSYRAEGLLQLESRAAGLSLPAGMQDLLGGGSAGTALGESEMAILRSRMVLRRAAAETGLELSAEPRPLPLLGNLPARLGLKAPDFAALHPFAWGNEAISLTALELPPELTNTPLSVTLTGPQTYTLALPDGSHLEGQVGQRLTLEERGISVLIDRLTGPEGREFLIERRQSDTATELARQSFFVVESPRNSALLRLSYTAQTPRRAEAILDAIIRAYLDQNIQRSAAEAQNSLEFIEEQLPLAEAEMARAQEALNAYRQEQNSVDVTYETRSLLEQATSIEAELNALALQEDELKKRYTPNHPTYQSLLETRDALQRRLKKIRAETTLLPQTQRDIFNLTRSLDVAQQVYLQLLNRAQELRVVRASTVGSVRIVDPAWSSGKNINTSLGRGLIISLALGLVLGILLTLIRRVLHRGIRGADQIEQLGLTVFATVNHTASAPQKSRRGTLEILALTQPEDVATEALRSLRTALHFGRLNAKNRAVLLTSAAPEAGKSFTAINLAVIAAQAGQTVCLIDADMRRGYLRRYLSRPRQTPGLAELLSDQKNLDEIMLAGPIPGLKVITSGRYPPNPSELLMRPSFAQLLDSLDPNFDLVVIDSPPVLAVTDAVLIGRQVGTILVLARHLQTLPGQIAAVQRSFQTAGIEVAGAILNGYRPDRAKTLGGYDSAYSYRYTYKKQN